MYQIALKELRALALESKDYIWTAAEEYNREPKLYLHWTAGHYAEGQESQCYLDDYHLAIDADGTVYAEHYLDAVLCHTYRRNTGAIGITMTCGVGSGSNGLGPEPPTAQQIESMAKVIAVLCDALDLPIDKAHVMTHGEAANNEDGLYLHPAYAWWNDEEGDGDTRGDLEYLGTDESPEYNPEATDGSRGGDVLRGKAIWYYNRFKEAGFKC